MLWDRLIANNEFPPLAEQGRNRVISWELRGMHYRY